MPQISDLRSDSPLNLICVASSYVGSSEHLSRARMFTVVAIVRFCYRSEVFGFDDPRSIHNPSSHPCNCFQRHSSPRFLTTTRVRTVVRGSSMLRRQLPDCCGRLQLLWAHSRTKSHAENRQKGVSSCIKVEEQ